MQCTELFEHSVNQHSAMQCSIMHLSTVMHNATQYGATVCLHGLQHLDIVDSLQRL